MSIASGSLISSANPDPGCIILRSVLLVSDSPRIAKESLEATYSNWARRTVVLMDLMSEVHRQKQEVFVLRVEGTIVR